MHPSKRRSGLALYLALGGILIALAYLLVPLVFGQRTEVSPFLLCAIVLVCNVAQGVVPEPAANTARAAFGVFCARLAVSALFSGLLVALHKFARLLA